MNGRLWKATVFSAAGILLATAITIPASTAGAADASTKYLGIFREASPIEIASGTVSRYGVTPASVQWFDSWATGNAFNVAAASALWNQGIVPHYTWEPWNTALGVDDPDQIHLQDIIDGEWNSYISARGAEFAATSAPIMVRWGHEFNGDWYPWGIVNNNSNPALYINAYRHVHDLVVAAGATNVQWVWAFNNASSPDTAFNDPAQSYPGDAYVDWVAIDGYNWGFGPSWDPDGDHWTSFESMFSSAYNRARTIAANRPVMISEVGSSEDGGNKAQWISDMSNALRSGSYPHLKAVIYFDQDKEERWSGTSSSAAHSAFTSWVNQTYLNGTGAELAQVAAQYQGTTPPPTTPPPAGACSATYQTVNTWPGGFQSEVTVRTGAAGIDGWTTRWNLASGQQISHLWNGTPSVDGSLVTVGNASWNGTLGVNATTTFGFNATGSPSTPTITCTSP
jgi:beta-mannanase